MERLRQLPQAFACEPSRAAHLYPAGSSSTQDSRLQIHQIFARRYTTQGRPWFGFHRDKGPLTVNVALSPDEWHDGGRLLGIYEGRVHSIERDEGEATVHPSTLLHAVSRMQGGVRYSLIVFYKWSADCADDVALA